MIPLLPFSVLVAALKSRENLGSVVLMHIWRLNTSKGRLSTTSKIRLKRLLYSALETPHSKVDAEFDGKRSRVRLGNSQPKTIARRDKLPTRS